jgi:phospholipase/carboxylesterase
MKLALDYKIRMPKTIQEKNPLILLLHGYGSNEEDLFSFESELPDTYCVVSAQAPYDMQYGSYAWYAINFDADENKFSDHEQAKKSRDLIVTFVDELLANYPLDAQNITLVGFSQGGILSYAVALSYPEKFNKIAALSSYLDPKMLTEDYFKNTFNKLNIFASHGTMDQVIPIEWARKTKNTLDNLSIKTTYKEYPMAHGIAPQNFHDFKEWLIE